MPDLIRWIHKNSMGLGRLIKTFRMHWGAKVLARSAVSSDPLGIRERSTSPTDNVTKSTDNVTKSTATSAEVSPFCKPKTPGGGDGEIETASGISKRQLEKKIQSIAVKEVRQPNSRQLWYVHDAVLEKYSIDGNALSPPLSSPSVATRLGCESSINTASPQTPCSSSGVGAMKRKVPKRVKSLFDFINTASLSSTGSGKVEGKSVSTTKHTKMDDAGGNAVKSTEPLLILAANNTITKSPNTIPNNTTATEGLEPPLKKARLDLIPATRRNDVIVIDSDNTNDKENSDGTLGKEGAVKSEKLAAKNPATLGGAIFKGTFPTPALTLLAKLLQERSKSSLH